MRSLSLRASVAGQLGGRCERRVLRQAQPAFVASLVAEEMLNLRATVLTGALLWPGKGRGLSCICVPITAKFTHRIKKIMADV